MIRCSDIALALQEAVPHSLQESYDNCGWQVGTPDAECSGVLVCVDATPARVKEALDLGANMIVSHHPLLFSGLKRITGDSQVQLTVMDAIRHGIAVYSLHTALDNSPEPFGVSLVMAKLLELHAVAPLDENGSGAVGHLASPQPLTQVLNRIKATFRSPVVRTSDVEAAPTREIKRIALCGGSGSFLIPKAVSARADLFLSSDISYHKFVDFASEIIIADIGHFESEECTKSIITQIIREKFPNFAVHNSKETNPISYY